ncbi:MAG TPA: FAD-dependent oxidoreductase [Gaiellaceae bacterium]|nr:FAD-dependent oxidoreductase [Gaiellaceae bacterium]
MERARAIVIGGGITGTSVAYHLARAGWTDTILLEKGELTSGSTCHAAGLVTQFNPSPTMMRFRRYSVELYRELGVFETVGSLRIASSPESLKELQRGASRARAIGLDVEVIGPEDAVELMPAATAESLYGAVWIPDDGAVDPHTATHALASAARDLGVRFLTGMRVTGIELGLGGEVRAVRTDDGRLETECVVNACGIWAPQVSAMVGAFTPSVPVDHQHIALAAVDGQELPREMPCFRDTDNLVYGRAEAGGMLFGGYEADPASRWEDGVPWEHGSQSLPPDEERFRPLWQGAIRRFPFLNDAGMVKLVCHPDAMTPDGNPLLGPLPGVRGFWLAAGLSLNGFGGAGGMGKTAAELITSGEPELDVHGYRPWRFGSPYRDLDFTTAAAREVYKYYYRLRYPLDSDEWGRPQRLSPLHGRLQELGAVFGTKNGWERADYFRPGVAWRRAGADQRGFGWTAPPYLDLLAEEHRAFREGVGIIDMTSFGKLELSGAGALPSLERVADNRIDRPVGSVVYTQFLDDRGGIVADVTVTRLAEDRFRVITGAGAIDSDRGWLELAAGETNGDVVIRDVTDELAVIGIWGPESRAVLEAITEDDVSGEALPFRRAKEVSVAGIPVLAQRITYVGELGFELYVERERAVQVWDRLVEAGGPYGITPGGYSVLDSLRLEKGYRYFGTDLTAGDSPLEAGLDFCVAWDKDFTGRTALEARRPERRLRTLLVGGPDYATVYGGEAIHLDGEVAGRVRSAGYGFTIGRNIALGYLPTGLEEGAEVGVEVFGELVPAAIAPDVLYDPGNERVRA